ncbi:MAG: hypothetical protein P8169_11610 [Chloroflexota bacterium]
MPTNAKKNLDLRFIFHSPPPDFRRSTTGGALDAHLLEVVRGGGVVDLVTAVVLEQAYELGLDAAGEENAAAVDLFPGIVAGMTAVSMTVKRSQEKSAG